MTKILFDMDTMKFTTMFETLTQTKLKDCFKEDNSVVFVVMPGYIAKAIGKQGINVKNIGNAIKKNVIIIEFNPDVVEFVKNLIRVRGIEVKKEENRVIVKCPDTKTKGLVFGREKERLRRAVSIVKRYFDIEDIKVE